jgi:hypothetical protein
MMSGVRRRNFLPLFLLGAVLTMAAVVYAEIRARPAMKDEPSQSPSAAEIRIAPLPQRQAMPQKKVFAAIVERPLFSQSRRPPSEEPSLEPAPSIDFSLSGIVISTGKPSALVKQSADADPVRIGEGEEVSGWMVERIESDRILVRHGSMETELLLDFTAPAPPPPEIANEAGTQATEEGAGESAEQASETDEPAQAPAEAPTQPAQTSAN